MNNLILSGLCMSLTFWSTCALPACETWDVSGQALSLNQSNVVWVNFDIVQSGPDLRGTAQSGRQERNAPLLGILPRGSDPVFRSGVVDGVLDGSTARLQVQWSDRKLGVYELTFDEFGRFRGTTYDFYHPSNRADVLGRDKVGCLVSEPVKANPPTYHKVGKGTPKSAPVSATDVQRARTESAVTISAPVSDICAAGYVWREAQPNDLVCVTPASRARAAAENSAAPSHWNPAGAYGPKTCRSGYVWREAVPGDFVCVTPEVRAAVREENRLKSSRQLN